jgi:glycosyltransferase involved in cell wall biosynthesis
MKTSNSGADTGRGRGLRVLAIFGYEKFFGAERANLRVLRFLTEAGAQVRCLISRQATPELRSALADAGVVTEEVKFGPSYFGLTLNLAHYARNLAGMVNVSRAVARVSKSFGPTHIYIPNYLQYLYGFPSLLFQKHPVVFRVGDPPELAAHHRFMWRNLISPFVRAFVANSESTRARLVSVGVPSEKISVIRNSVLPYPGNSGATHRQDFHVIYVGQLTPHKGVDLAVEAALAVCARKEDVRFSFVGPVNGESAFVSSLLARVSQSSYRSRIQFVGYDPNILPLLANASIHICPSVQPESSANVVLEAKSAGLPSVVFPNGGLPELVQHEIDGYVCAEPTVASLIQGIMYFLDDPDRLQRSALAAQKSSALYSPEAVAKEWRLLFSR